MNLNIYVATILATYLQGFIYRTDSSATLTTDYIDRESIFLETSTPSLEEHTDIVILMRKLHEIDVIDSLVEVNESVPYATVSTIPLGKLTAKQNNVLLELLGVPGLTDSGLSPIDDNSIFSDSN